MTYNPARRNISPMAFAGRLRWRLALAVAAMALLPLLVATVVARSMVKKTAERFYVPEIGTRLDQSLGLYQELAKTIKLSMRYAADAIAADAALRRAAARGDAAAVRDELKNAFLHYPSLVELVVETADGEVLARADRGRPVDASREKQLEVTRALTDQDGSGPSLRAVFATDRARLEELEGMGQFIETYRKIEQRRAVDERSYLSAFVVLLGLTVLVAAALGLFMARGPTVRLAALSTALQKVGGGDLSVRVPTSDRDEIGDLTRAFNRMVGEIEASRARIEYLQRINAWQEMARRLAHEITNPLTPIQLAVQEVHRRCPEGVPGFRQLVDDTLTIVQDEVETLRGLVSEFSNFARMPQAELKEADLAEFLRSHQRRFELLEEGEQAPEETPVAERSSPLPCQISFDIPASPAMAYFDSQMLKRALVNLMRNAAQATNDTEVRPGHVLLRLSRGEEYWVLDVDDDGPGIDKSLREVVFDPYFTTKKSGTGLGLAIVKKVVIEHGGTIVAGQSEMGGARIRIQIPRPGTTAAAVAQSAAVDVPSSPRHA